MQKLFHRLTRQGAGLLVASLLLGAGDGNVTDRMAELLRYSGVENAAPVDVAHMADLWENVQQPGLSNTDRRLKFREMYLLYYKMHGRDLSARPQSLDSLAGYVTTLFEGGAQFRSRLPEPRGKPVGNYLRVEHLGQGPVPLLLISDLGVDGRSLYASFAKRQANAYTLSIVTLPSAGAARPLPWPVTLDYTARPWLNQIEGELLALVDAPSMKGVTVLGTGAGGYFAARVALLRPQQVRSCVLVNSLVKSSLRSPDNPDAPASTAQRLARAKTSLPGPQLFPVAPVPPSPELKRLIEDPHSTHPIARNWMAFAVKDVELSRAWTFEALSQGFFTTSQEYSGELASTDLTDALQELKVPMLVMGSWHDEGSPAVNSPTVSEWEEVKLRRPQIPLTIVTFDDTRAYVSEDAPEHFDRALADFIAARAVHGKQGFSLPRISPRASVMQAVAGTDIRIVYGSPAVKQRKIWGALVPNGRVWRAGANEATRFYISQDVEIENHALATGNYTILSAPRSTGLDRNLQPRASPQWGAFDYDPAFDALRFTVKPEEAPQQECLRYTIDPAGANAAIVAMRWEKLSIAFRVEARP